MPRRTVAEAEQTRRNVLAAAREMFATLGYEGATAVGIAAAAGVTRGALYHHFTGKAELFQEVFEAIEHELNATVLAAATHAIEAGGDARDAFLAACRTWLDFGTRTDYQQIAMADAPAVLGLATWHRIDTEIGLSSMQMGLEIMAAEGMLEPPPDRALATLLFGALTEAGLALARADDDLSRDNVWAQWTGLIDRLAPGAAPRPNVDSEVHASP